MKAIPMLPCLASVVFLSLADPAWAVTGSKSTLEHCNLTQLTPMEILPRQFPKFPQNLTGFVTAKTKELLPAGNKYTQMITLFKIDETKLSMKSKADFTDKYGKDNCLIQDQTYTINVEKRRLESDMFDPGFKLYVYLIGGSINAGQVVVFGRMLKDNVDVKKLNFMAVLTFGPTITPNPAIAEDSVKQMCGAGYNISNYFEILSDGYRNAAVINARCKALVNTSSTSSCCCLSMSYSTLSIFLSYYFFMFLL